MYTIQRGGFIPGFRNTMPRGLFPVESEIPLATVTENTGLFLEGARLWVFTNILEDRGDQRPGPSVLRREPAALPGSGGHSGGPWALGTSLPLHLLPLGGGRAEGRWLWLGLGRRGAYSASCLVSSPPQPHLVSVPGGVRPQSVCGNPHRVVCTF